MASNSTQQAQAASADPIGALISQVSSQAQKETPAPEQAAAATGSVADSQQAQASQPDTERENNLRVLSGLTGPMVAGLSPQERYVLNQIVGQQLNIAPKGPGGTWSDAQLQQIRQQASQDLTNHLDAQTAQQLQQQIQNSPWSQISQALVGQLQQLAAPVEQAVSGAEVPQAESAAMATALAAAGPQAAATEGGWAAGQAAQGQENNVSSGLTAALQSYGQAYQTGVNTVGQAIGNLGAANALAVGTAPESAWLQAASQPGAVTYKESPATASLPPAIQWALQQAGWGYGEGAGAQIQTPKGGWGSYAPPGTQQGPQSSNIAAALSGVPATNPATTPGQSTSVGVTG